MDTVGKRLLYLRTVADLSGSELARLAGISRAYPSALERGSGKSTGARMAHDLAARIASVFGAKTEWFATGAGKPPSEQTIRRAVSRARSAVNAA
jgi:transcriptional regulator with XRE-family HTH domain